jgi:dihydroxyacetone kinase phosphoprotein-dependent L subunit
MIMTVLNAKEMLLYVADKVIENKPYLTEVDSAIGDGDHGIGMETGFKKVIDTLNGGTFETVNQVFAHAGKSMLMSMGGASGVIFGSMFLEGAKAVPQKEVFDEADIAKLFRNSLAAIQKRGGASVGDKTMVDALDPAVVALEENVPNGLNAMLAAADSAAKAGMENTKDMVAKFGRAKSLMERAIGFQDAGATSVWIIFRSMREFFEEKR